MSVDVRKLQFAMLAQSSREMSKTVRIDYHELASQFGLAIRPTYTGMDN